MEVDVSNHENIESTPTSPEAPTEPAVAPSETTISVDKPKESQTPETMCALEKSRRRCALLNSGTNEFKIIGLYAPSHSETPEKSYMAGHV